MKKMVISLFSILIMLFSTTCYAQDEQNAINSLQTATRNQSNNERTGYWDKPVSTNPRKIKKEIGRL